MDSIDVELSGASSTPAERTSTAAAGAGEGSWRRMRRSIAGSTANAGGNGSPGSMRKGSTRNLLSRKSSRAILGSSASTPGASPGASSAALAHRDSDSFSHHSKTAGVSRIWRSLLGGKKTASAMEHSYYRQTKWEGAAKLVRDHGDTVVSVALSSDDTHFAAAGVNKVVRVFHTSQGQQVCEVTAPHVIGSIVFIGRRKLVAGTYGGLVHFYDVCEEAEEAQVKVNEGQQIECMACARGGTRLAVGGKFADVIVYAVQYADANAPCVPDTEGPSEKASNLERFWDPLGRPQLGSPLSLAQISAFQQDPEKSSFWAPFWLLFGPQIGYDAHFGGPWADFGPKMQGLKNSLFFDAHF